MRPIKIIFFALVLAIVTFISCQKTSTEAPLSVMLRNIPNEYYYPSEIFQKNNQAVYGTWKVFSTSGGFAAGGYKADFEFLVLKSSGIFGIVKNNELMSSGKIEIVKQTDSELEIRLVPEKKLSLYPFEILNDPEKIVTFKNDTLNLNAPCCDRYNTHLVRIK